MTPERMNELATWLEKLPLLYDEPQEIAAFLRECAKADPVGTKLYPAPQVLSSIDERAEFDKWWKSKSIAFRTDADAESALIAWLARAKPSAPEVVSKTTDTVVPDGLLDAVKEIAGSHTDNEITDRPVWWIIDPYQMMSPSVHKVYSMFKGPFFSREAATKYMEGHRYRYGKHVKVYCGSCNDAPQFKKLYDMSKAMLKGGEK